MSANPKDLLKRGFVIIGKEIDRLEKAAQAAADSGGSMKESERNDLCSYMNVLRQLVGKDIEDDEEFDTQVSDDELLKTIEEHAQQRQAAIGSKSENRRRRSKTPSDDAGG